MFTYIRPETFGNNPRIVLSRYVLHLFFVFDFSNLDYMWTIVFQCKSWTCWNVPGWNWIINGKSCVSGHCAKTCR